MVEPLRGGVINRRRVIRGPRKTQHGPADEGRGRVRVVDHYLDTQVIAGHQRIPQY